MPSLEELAATIESVPSVLRSLLSPLDPDVLQRRPEPGEWCALEVIGHLITCEGPAFRGRIQRIVEGETEILNFDPNAALVGRGFESADLADLIDQLEAERAESASYLRTLAPEDLDRSGEHSKYGTMLAGDFAYEWPFHDQDHLQQILAAVKPRYLESMSPQMRSAMGVA